MRSPVEVCDAVGRPADLRDGPRRLALPVLDVDDGAGAALAAVLLLPLPVRARADDGRALKDAAQLDLSRARSRREDDDLQYEQYTGPGIKICRFC